MLLKEEIDVGWFIIGNNHISSDVTRSKMKEYIKTLQTLRRMQLHEVYVSLGLANGDDFSITFMSEDCITHANEVNAIIIFYNL